MGKMVAFRRLLAHRSTAVFINMGVLLFTTNMTIFLIAALVDVGQSSLWFICLSAWGFLLVTDMGTSYPLSRLLALRRGTVPRLALGEAGSPLLRFFIKRVRFPFLLLGLVLLGYILVTQARTGANGKTLIEVSLLWVGVAAYGFLAMLSKLLQFTNEGLGKLREERLSTSAIQIVLFVGIAMALFITHSIWPLPFLYIAGFAVQSWVLYKTAKGKSKTEPQVNLDTAILQSLSGESRRYWLLAVFTTLSQSIQVMSLALLADPHAIAPYFFLQRLDSGIGNVLGFILVIDRSIITHLLGQRQNSAALAIMRRNHNIIIVVAMVGAIAMAVTVFACNGFNLLKFYIPTNLMTLFIVDLLLNGAFIILSQYLLATGENPFLIWIIACAVLTVALQFILVPRFGPMGAIGAYLLAQMLTIYPSNIYYYLRMVRRLRQPVDTARGAPHA
jgi:hypothetical protein